MISDPLASPPESWEQAMYFVHLRNLFSRWPELGYAYHIPNGGKRHKVTAAKLKKEGVKPGVPDIDVPVRRGCFTGLHIELKRRPWRDANGKLHNYYPDRNQKAYLEFLESQGRRAIVCHGYDEALSETIKYMEQSK